MKRRREGGAARLHTMPKSYAKGVHDDHLAHRERGSVTVEFALVLPLVVLLLGFALSVQSIAAKQIGVQDHARQAARLASAGVGATEIASLMDLNENDLDVRSDSPWVTVRVQTTHQFVGILSLSLTLDAHASALLESEIARWP